MGIEVIKIFIAQNWRGRLGKSGYLTRRRKAR